MSKDLCPCGSGKEYGECCEPIIKGTALAASPEALMRSRYTAYAKHEIKWLKDSLEATQRSDFDEPSVTAWSNDSEWLGIEIKQTKTEEEKNIGWVEFIARFKQGNITRNHHELGWACGSVPTVRAPWAQATPVPKTRSPSGLPR